MTKNFLPALHDTTRTGKQPVLGVKRKLFRADDEHAQQADKAFQALRQTVLQRDQNKCRYCEFSASKWQEVHHVDDDHDNNVPDNLLTCCTLCHQVHHLGMCGIRNGGFLAVIPELTQTEVNHLARYYFVSERLNSPQTQERLRSLYAIFEFRGADYIKPLYGMDFSSPMILGEILSTVFTDEQYARRGEILSPLRLVPRIGAFHDGQLDFYAKVMPIFKENQWEPLYKLLLKGVA